jgi:hypothetical protein
MMGDTFGESEILKVPDYSYFGDIYASEKSDTKVIFISYPAFRTIPLYELEIIYENMKDYHSKIQYTVCQKQKINPRVFDGIHP